MRLNGVLFLLLGPRFQNRVPPIPPQHYLSSPPPHTILERTLREYQPRHHNATKPERSAPAPAPLPPPLPEVDPATPESVPDADLSIDVPRPGSGLSHSARGSPDSTQDSGGNPEKSGKSERKIECSPGYLVRDTVKVELMGQDLWKKFHRLGTEMIITKAGR